MNQPPSSCFSSSCPSCNKASTHGNSTRTSESIRTCICRSGCSARTPPSQLGSKPIPSCFFSSSCKLPEGTQWGPPSRWLSSPSTSSNVDRKGSCKRVSRHAPSSCCRAATFPKLLQWRAHDNEEDDDKVKNRILEMLNLEFDDSTEVDWALRWTRLCKRFVPHKITVPWNPSPIYFSSPWARLAGM